MMQATVPAALASPHRPIATLNEGPLHAALKAWYFQDGDGVEVPVAGCQIDLVRDDLLIEIQTRRLGALRGKLERLLVDHRVHLVHPVARERWIVRIDDHQQPLGRRRSPKHGRVEDVFKELVGLSGLLTHPNFSFEVLLTQEEELRRHEPGKAWRRGGWVTAERRLLEVLESRVFRGAADLKLSLPGGLPEPFTTADLAEKAGIPRSIAQKMAYCLRRGEVIGIEGKQGNSVTYRIVP